MARVFSWRGIVALYFICYFSVSLVIWLFSRDGTLFGIVVSGMIVISPYVLYNLFRKKEPDIETLY